MVRMVTFGADIRYFGMFGTLPADRAFEGLVRAAKTVLINQDADTLQTETVATLQHTPLKE